ncbi:putative 26S proteasome regulatory subunit [Emydomyces testavorans]|uniref:Probable 26S proteasome regulatory subunit p27 n=1 Tax=Emydomyces testavorans TaxID=2070801 RepID=A0AAF0IMA6_9EURO|nr:putative 26S proteasome regulatory subunit [Emydomyces testavorans]
MGIPMDDIHAPTVPSGPTSRMGGERDISKLSVTELFKEKERIEAELKALSAILQSHGVNMETPLTTFDGYPRDDLDIAQIRTTRARIIHLRNDHKAVMAKIEQGVHSYFADIRDREARGETFDHPQVPPAAPELTEETNQSELVETPFAKVNSVADGSPAAQAGIKPGDRIRSFGIVNWMNHENLRKVSEVVQNNEGMPLIVGIARASESGQGLTNLSLRLTPRRDWGGRGLLGCHLIPL